MSSLGTLLGKGISSGGATTLVLTVTEAQAVSDNPHLFWLAARVNPDLKQPGPSAISDSVEGTWTFATSSQALIGFTDVSDSSSARYQIGSFLRTDGPLLQVGDTITVTYLNNASHPPPDYGIAIAQCFRNMGLLAIKQNWGDYGAAVDISPGAIFVSYANGDSGVPPILWRVDYAGMGLNPAPAQNCAYIAAFGSHGGSAFVPDQLGSVVAEHTNGSFYLAAVFAGSVPATSIGLEPGGSFTGGASAVGNYQFVESLGCPPSVLWFYKDGQWRQQNVDPDYSLWFYKDGQWQQDCDQLTGFLENAWQT